MSIKTTIQSLGSLVDRCLLNRWCWLLPFLLWSLAVFLSATSGIDSIRQQSLDLARASARNSFDIIQLTRSWNAEHGGVFVPATTETPPNPYLEPDMREMRSADGTLFVRVNPAYMTRQISELAESHDIYFHITSLKPLRPENAADSWEAQALQQFNRGLNETWALIDDGESRLFRYMAPLTVKQECLKCHEQQGYQLGDVRGGISVTYTAAQFFGADDVLARNIIFRHLSVYLVFSVISIFLLERIRSQWLAKEQEVEDRTLALTESNARLLAENEERRLLGMELEQSEQQVRLLLDSTGEGIYGIDANGVCVIVNNAAVKLLGFDSASELLGKRLHSLIHHHRADGSEHLECDCPVIEVTQNETAVRIPSDVFWRKDGESLPVEYHANPMYEDGKLVGAVVSFIDISERLAYQEKLERSEARFRNLFENSNSGVVIYDVVDDGQDFVFKSFNRRAEEIEAVEREAILGRRVTEVFPGVEEFGLLDVLKRVARSGVPEHLPITHYQDGRIAGWRENYVYRLDTGEIVAIYDDLTEQKILEQELKRSEERLKLAMEATNDGVWDWNVPTGRVYYSSRWRTMLGYAPDENLGDDFGVWERLVHPEDLPRVSHELQKHMEGKSETYECEIRMLTKTGDWKWVLTRGRVVEKDEDGRPLRVAGTHVDISDRKQAEAEASRNAREWNEAMDYIEDVIYVLDTERHLKKANQAFYRMLQTTPEQAIGRHIAKIIHPEGEETPCRVCRAQEALRDEIITMESSHPDNPSGRPIEVTVRVIRDNNDEATGILMAIRDLSRLREIEESQRLATTVFESTIEGVVVTDRDEKIVAINRAFTEITGYREQEVLGETPKLLASGRHDKTFFHRMWNSIDKVGHWSGEIWNRRKDGSVFPEWLTVNAVYDDRNELTHYVGVFSDITEIKTSQERLEYLAHHDPLTDLPNRRLFSDRLEHALKRAKRDNRRIAVLFIDLDRFKYVNDSLGHTRGDEVLTVVAERLQSVIREEDTIARLGGDEFIVLMEGIREPADAVTVAQKIISAMRDQIDVADQSLYLGASVGISLYPDDGESVELLVQGADAAMYQAKEHGRNNYQFYSSELTTRAFEWLLVEGQLREALARQEFELYYQPQLDMKTGRIIGAEALLRWNHSTLGFVSPGTFIPVAEESGLIIGIGKWVLETACADMVQWLADGLSMDYVAVNIAGAQIKQSGFITEVNNILQHSGLEPDKLELEITEGFIMDRAQHGIEVLGELRQIGTRLAIDDFGTGYSSLSYLKKLPIDRLKIDQSFVRDIPQDENDAAITRAIIALGHSLHLEVIAEGVETLAQREYLIEQGCQLAQGFLYSRAVPATEFRSLLQRQIIDVDD